MRIVLLDNRGEIRIIVLSRYIVCAYIVGNDILDEDGKNSIKHFHNLYASMTHTLAYFIL